MKKIMIVGATSAMAHEVGKCFAATGAELFLVGRDAQKLGSVRDDLEVRGASRAESYVLDLTETARHREMLDKAVKSIGDLDAVLIAYGTLANQQECALDPAETLKEFAINCTSVIALLTMLANYFQRRKQGTIAVITSVAGDRGRQSNYVYGAAKGAVSIFLQGLRNRLYPSGVKVVTIKPGFVDTPMTSAIEKNALFATPQRVGVSIHRAMLAGKSEVYVPWFWRPIMAAVKSVPEFLFKKLKL